MALVCKPLHILTKSVHIGVLEDVDGHDDLIVTVRYDEDGIEGRIEISYSR
jgi:hypothetical protein